jgi:hypothetical protein
MKQSKRLVYVKCPYCGLENRALTGIYGGKELVVCDIEDGGCDRPFVVETTVVINIKTYILIEAPNE